MRAPLNLYDLCYAAGIGAAAPFWILRKSARAKVLSALADRMGDVPARQGDAPNILIHAVSVGEVNSTPSLIRELARHRPDLRFIVSTTTQTGFDRSRQLYPAESGVTLIRFPLDFTPAVARVLDRLRPAAVVLMELEVWPNFMRQCRKRSIPVMVANGRITVPAMRRYRWAGPITRLMFHRLTATAVQDETFADRFASLGVPREKLHVLGTMKFDSATVADRVDGDTELAQAVGLRPGAAPIWVCGSTGPGEERIVLAGYRALLREFPALRLVIVPRHPPRFDEVADLIQASGFELTRRSKPHTDSRSGQGVILGDTMGELRKFYSLASVVFVGRTLVDLGPRQSGSDMIEPAALGKAVIVGPYTANFDMPMRVLRAADAIVQIESPDSLAGAVRSLVSEPARARAMGERARQAVIAAQGSTRRHAELILRFLPQPPTRE